MSHNILSKKVASASFYLPTTESADKLHCRRAYYQIMAWMGKEEVMNAVNWGWTLQDKQYVPLMSSKNIAQDSLLKVIHCNCSTNCKTLRCSCR
ncbi:hypothetical protein PR048_025722 [Dryococelus australis]|uniref:Uncharacterized protein n=1 Tax=Dryococelus australis TaxID=614101 RepID=A0ABQ9GJC2_9NEOP|nr:hypothetical protein PR048_025722 [Dryococelus australis]